jgi:hypothetical protein
MFTMTIAIESLNPSHLKQSNKMAKSKKKNEADDQEDVTMDQKNLKEGAGADTTAAHEEEYEEKQSRPGNKRNDKQQTEQDREVYNEGDSKEDAAGSPRVPMKKKLKDVGAQAMRDAKSKSQSQTQPTARPKRKEPSKASSSQRAAKSRRPMKKKAASPKAKTKSKSKSR